MTGNRVEPTSLLCKEFPPTTDFNFVSLLRAITTLLRKLDMLASVAIRWDAMELVSVAVTLNALEIRLKPVEDL